MNENRATSPNEMGVDIAVPTESPVESMNHIERHPNLTLLETGQNPGDLLRSAREKAGFSLSDISGQTKINERLLIALESGDVANMPPETFAKAFIKSYCKALRMDSLPVILSFGFSEGSNAAKVISDAQVEMTRIEASEPKMPAASRRLNTLSFDRKPSKSIGYVVALVALGLLAAFYLPVFLGERVEKTEVAPTLSESNQSPDSVATEPVGVEAPSTSLPDGQLSSSSDVSEQGQVPPDASTPFPSLQPQPLVSVPEVVVAPVAPSSGKVALLKLTFEAPSWITVTDATEQVLISKLQNTAGSVELKGQAPFKVIVGDAKVVKILNNGKSVDLLAVARQGKVARLTIQ